MIIHHPSKLTVLSSEQALSFNMFNISSFFLEILTGFGRQLLKTDKREVVHGLGMEYLKAE